MKVAFVNPSVGFGDDRRSIPVGLAYIMAYLRSNGYESTGFDFADSTAAPEDLVVRHDLWRNDVVGLSVYTDSFHTALRMAAEIKRRNSGSYVVMGGPQATATHESIVRDRPCIDAVIRREGEVPALELLRSLDRTGSALDAVPNLTWRAGDGTVRVNPEMPALEDLDLLPFPDAEFVAEHDYGTPHFFDPGTRQLRPALAINTSRSCPYNCSFCGVLTIGRRYRTRSPESVVAELAHFRERHEVGYKHVYFSDANFFVRAERALEICLALHAFDSELTFSFGTRVNQVLRAQEIIEKMTGIGLRFIELGIESASPSVLQRLAKGVEPSVNEAAVRLLNRLGIGITLDFIMVDPASTVDDLQLNMAFIEKYFTDYYPHEHFYTHLALYEGTPIRDYYAERRGVPFESGVLPDTRELFEQPELLCWWDISQRFGTVYQPDIDATLAEAEALIWHPRTQRCLRDPESALRPDLARLQLDLITLRHAPLMFFRRLVDALSTGVLPTDPEEVGLDGFGVSSKHLREVIDRFQSSMTKIAAELDVVPQQPVAARQ
ncbi:MAG: radical protein [Actinomycetia bacterium]|nr:radical protein [Actinomycetes bacterium]